MLDMEKVLQALQHCPDDCSDCYTGGPGFGIACRDQLRRDVLALLKGQDPVPVKQCEINHMLFWCCGSCGAAMTYGDKFCRKCGKAGKWNA